MEALALSKDQHAQSLERLCVSALSSGDAQSAFMLADRRCRILPHAESHHFALRAEALVRLGHQNEALSDILAALALSPEDIQANRRLLSWGNQEQKAAAARALIAHDDDAGVLAQALAVLGEQGCGAAGAVRMTDDAVAGWAVWNGPVAPSLHVSDHDAEASITLDADPGHPLAGGSFDHAASFHVQRAPSPTGHVVRLMLSDAEFSRTRGGANVRAGEAANDGGALHLDPADVTVIVPIYRDYDATRACLESVEAAIAGKTCYRVLLVNDATPEQELEDHLRTFAGKQSFEVLTNGSNLGFVGSVNRAISMVGSGDVVLLNADTVVPRDFLARMTAIARSDPAIGTITPLSNNGEFTSFPIPFEQNPLPVRATVDAIDTLAASVNRGEVVDLPNGIGFCLYITRSCLDQVGLLSPSYARGYLEDVDFCLRARELGFRNVCAPSIYVGHAGSRSFGTDKRALVVRNVAVVESRFPDYRQECALFMTADPLRRARQAIERGLKPARPIEHLLICGDGLLETVADARASALRERGKSALLLCVGREMLHLRASDGEAPQSLTFTARLAGVADLFDYLQAVCFESVEIVEPAAVSDALMRMLKKLGRPIGVAAADAGLVCPRGTLIEADGSICSTLGTDSLCASCVSVCRGGTTSRAQWQARWAGFEGKSVPVSGGRAKGFAAFVAGGARPREVSSAGSAATPMRSRAKRTGIVVQSSTVDEFHLIQRFLRGALRSFPEHTYVVAGETADDLALMAIGNAFVAGAVDAARCAAVFDQYGLEKLILPLRRPLDGHPIAKAAERSGLPTAYFDWSFGWARPRAGDLAIDPRVPADELVSLLGAWVEA